MAKAKTLWQIVSAASTTHWLWSVAGGVAVSAASTLLGLPLVTQIGLALALLVAVTATILTLLERRGGRVKPPREQKPDLASRREPGERLLLEARLPQTTATGAQIDEFMGRVGEWVDSITAILIADDDRERLKTWSRAPWHRGRPQPRDSFEAQQYLAGPISERLTMLEGFCRDRSDAPQ